MRVTPGELADLGVHVVRQREVEQDQRLALGGTGPCDADDLGTDEAVLGAGAADDQVHLGQRRGHVGEVERAAPGDARGHALGDGRRAVGHHHPTGSAGDQGGSRQGPHRPCADDEHPALGEVTEDLGSGIEGDGHHGDAGAVDAGLGVDPLAGSQGPLADAVEHASGGTAVLAPDEAGTHLAQYLGLAHHHRVQSCGDGEQVGHGGGVEVHVAVLDEGPAIAPRPLGHQVGNGCHRRVEAGHVGVDLDPVAGRQDHRLGDDVAGREVGREPLSLDGGESQLIENPGGSRSVVDAHDEEGHALATGWCISGHAQMPSPAVASASPRGVDATSADTVLPEGRACGIGRLEGVVRLSRSLTQRKVRATKRPHSGQSASGRPAHRIGQYP